MSAGTGNHSKRPDKNEPTVLTRMRKNCTEAKLACFFIWLNSQDLTYPIQ